VTCASDINDLAGYQITRSKQAAFPFTRNLTVEVIASAGDRLWKELVGESKTMKVTNVQLAFTGLEIAESGQQLIETFFKTPDRKQQLGPNSLGEPFLKRVREGEDSDNASHQTATLEGEESTACIDSSSTSFICQRCRKRLYLAESAANDIDEDGRVEALQTLRMEHDDFHFAQDLANTSDEPQKAKKKRKEPEGIAKFFNKK
jgi:DNA polymerase eta